MSNPPAQDHRPTPLRVLLIEDSEDDALLVGRALARGGYDVQSVRVETAETLREALCAQTWDLILSDYRMPQFDGQRAYRVVRDAGVDVPFIIVSGTLGERNAVKAMQAGVADYILKSELEWLQPAVERALRDWAARRQAREAARQSQARLQIVLDQLPAAVWTTDADLRVTFIMGEPWSGLSLPAEGQRWDDHGSHSAEHAVAVSAHQRALAGEVVDYDDRHGDRIYESHVRPAHSTGGTVTGVIGFALDVTDRRRLELQLRAAQKMEAVGRLAGGIAHDFNNVLGIIQGAVGFLEAAVPDEGEAREDIEAIQQAVTRAEALTKQLLAFSRLQRQQLQALDLNVVVDELRKMLERVIGDDVELACSLAGTPLWVTADVNQLEQVLMNLAVNARDAMPGGGTLTIETCQIDLDDDYATRHAGARPGRFATLAVTDTGCGMDDDTRARLFEPFFTTKPPDQGTGLGLATVYGIVKQSKGYIDVESEPGRGTTFKVFLPAQDAPAATSPESTAPVAAVGGTETLLLVEDDDGFRRVATRFLRRHGYHVLVAANGADALVTAARHPGPLHGVVTDVVMPGMNGVELATRLRATRPDLPILLMSGHAPEHILRRGIESDFALIAKPFAERDLLRKVRDSLTPSATPNTGGPDAAAVRSETP